MSIKNTVLNNALSSSIASAEFNKLQKFYMALEASSEGNIKEADAIIGLPNYKINNRLKRIVEEQHKKKAMYDNFHNSQHFEGKINIDDANNRSYTISENAKIPYGRYNINCNVKQRGVKPNTVVEYGRMVIDAIKLVKNELSVNYKDSRHKPTGYKTNRKISKQLKENITDLIEGKGVDISKLKPQEQKFIKKFQRDSRMDGDLVGGCLDDLKTLTGRLDVLKGEMKAGNNNKEIKNQISDIINKLVQLGALTVKDAIKASKDLIINV